jgi:hypothetical protein
MGSTSTAMSTSTTAVKVKVQVDVNRAAAPPKPLSDQFLISNFHFALSAPRPVPPPGAS